MEICGLTWLLSSQRTDETAGNGLLREWRLNQTGAPTIRSGIHPKQVRSIGLMEESLLKSDDSARPGGEATEKNPVAAEKTGTRISNTGHAAGNTNIGFSKTRTRVPNTEHPTDNTDVVFRKIGTPIPNTGHSTGNTDISFRKTRTRVSITGHSTENTVVIAKKTERMSPKPAPKRGFQTTRPGRLPGVRLSDPFGPDFGTKRSTSSNSVSEKQGDPFPRTGSFGNENVGRFPAAPPWWTIPRRVQTFKQTAGVSRSRRFFLCGKNQRAGSARSSAMALAIRAPTPALFFSSAMLASRLLPSVSSVTRDNR